MFRVAVAGSVVLDEIVRGKKKFKSFGGITYNIVALLKLLEEVQVFPVTYIGKHDFEEWRSLFESTGKVDFQGVRIFKESNRNKLIYKNGERDEFFIKKTPPIDFKMLLPFIDVDAFIVNFIKNDDMTFETLKTLSYAFKGLLYIDIHSLLREVNESGQFVLRPLKNWQNWVPMADVLQMNREEAVYFTGIEANTIEELKKLALLILTRGAKMVNITLGERGAVVAYKEENFASVEYIEAPEVRVVDPTGAGDVYGAALISQLLTGKSPLDAARFAVSEASKSVEIEGLPLD